MDALDVFGKAKRTGLSSGTERGTEKIVFLNNQTVVFVELRSEIVNCSIK